VLPQEATASAVSDVKSAIALLSIVSFHFKWIDLAKRPADMLDVAESNVRLGGCSRSLPSESLSEIRVER
jgi:hypothetical protein